MLYSQKKPIYYMFIDVDICILFMKSKFWLYINI